MADQQFLNHLFPGHPFFGGATAGIQGERVRHFFMSAAVSLAAKETPSLSILEIGSWTGSSTMTWAQALDSYCIDQGRILCVDPWLPYFSDKQLQQDANYQLMANMSGLEITYNLFLHNTKFVPQGVKIDHMRGFSVDILPYLKEKSFDMVYIDGDHAYENALYDIVMAKKLVKPGGLICGDDLEVQGVECDLTFLRENRALDILPVPTLKRNCHPGVTLAVHEEFGEVSAYHGFWVMRALDEDTYEKVSLNGQQAFVPSHFSDDEKSQVLETLQRLGINV